MWKIIVLFCLVTGSHQKPSYDVPEAEIAAPTTTEAITTSTKIPAPVLPPADEYPPTLNISGMLRTSDVIDYHYYPFHNGIVQFRVRTKHDANIILAGEASESNPKIKVTIGGWGNGKSVIRYNDTKRSVALAYVDNILKGEEFRGFWIRANDDVVAVGYEDETEPFMSWNNTHPFDIKYVGVSTGEGADGTWLVDGYYQPQQRWRSSTSESTPSRRQSDIKWVASSNGNIPDGAVSGGIENGELIYIARAEHGWITEIANLVPSQGAALVPWGGSAHSKRNYEVLVGCEPKWIRTKTNEIPSHISPQNGNNWVCRVHHQGIITIGKKGAHSVCYIPHAGREIAFQSYDLLSCE